LPKCHKKGRQEAKEEARLCSLSLDPVLTCEEKFHLEAARHKNKKLLCKLCLFKSENMILRSMYLIKQRLKNPKHPHTSYPFLGISDYNSCYVY